MRNCIILLALLMSAFTFGQDQGQWSFGVGTNFTSTNEVAADFGYFVMDGLMVQLSFEMATESWEDEEDNYTDWSIGARYYIGEEGLWAGFKMSNAPAHYEWDEDLGPVGDGEESGMDMWLGVGCSKALGFDDKLWFEPWVGLDMPAAGWYEDSYGGGMVETDQIIFGLGANFRFTF